MPEAQAWTVVDVAASGVTREVPAAVASAVLQAVQMAVVMSAAKCRYKHKIIIRQIVSQNLMIYDVGLNTQ